MAYDVTKLARLSALKAVGTKVVSDYAKESVLNGIVVSGENAANITVTGTTSDTTEIFSASAPSIATYTVQPAFTDEAITDTSITLADMLDVDTLAGLTGIEEDGTTVYTFTVNEAEITCTQSSTLAEIMSSINDSDGATITYSSEDNEFTFVAKTAGSTQNMLIKGDVGIALFGDTLAPENLLMSENKGDEDDEFHYLYGRDGKILFMYTNDSLKFLLRYYPSDGKFYRFDSIGAQLDKDIKFDLDDDGDLVPHFTSYDITQVTIDGVDGATYLQNVLETLAGRVGFTVGADTTFDVKINGTSTTLTSVTSTVTSENMSITLITPFTAYESNDSGDTVLNPDKVVSITSPSGKVASSIKSGSVSGKTVNLYTSTDATGDAIFSFEFPVELATSLTKTKVVSDFAFSTKTYPGATDPSLDGHVVIVLAVSGDDGSISYSFMDMNSLIDVYTAKVDGKDPSTTVTVTDNAIGVLVNRSADAGNQLKFYGSSGSDLYGWYVSISDTTDISNKADKATTLAGYGITDAYTKTEFDEMATVTYIPSGSVAFSDLPALNSENVGKVYNMLDDFTTDENFIEDANVNFPAGTNVAIVATEDGYAYDVLSGSVDLSGYAKVSDVPTVEASETAGAISVDGTDVQIVDIATDEEFSELLDELFSENA